MDTPAPASPSRSRRAAIWLYREALPLLVLLALLVIGLLLRGFAMNWQ